MTEERLITFVSAGLGERLDKIVAAQLPELSRTQAQRLIEEGFVAVDGRPATVLRANGLFRAVRVPAGSHSVRFSYEPRAVRAGLALSLAGVLAALALAGALSRDGRSERSIERSGPGR